jgi:DNA-binding HxlR family transcriptional regulator
MNEGLAGYPWNAVLRLLGDKWSLIVIRDIMVANRRHFQELLSKSEEGISAVVLESRLKKLADDGMVICAQDASHQDAAIISLTERSIQLVPVLVQICAWGTKHCAASEPLIGGASSIVHGGPRLQRAFIQKLRRRHLAALPSP